MPQASLLEQVNEEFSAMLTPARIRSMVSLIPAVWLRAGMFPTEQDHLDAYAAFLETRIAHSAQFTKEASDAREALI